MNDSYHERYVLDAFAILCYLEDEAGADTVALLLHQASAKEIKLMMTWTNLGEVYYRVIREYGELQAEKVLVTVKDWPVQFIPGDEDLTLTAARVKAAHALSYADAFCIAAALTHDAAVVTGDPEIKQASQAMGFPLTWLGQ